MREQLVRKGAIDTESVISDKAGGLGRREPPKAVELLEAAIAGAHLNRLKHWRLSHLCKVQSSWRQKLGQEPRGSDGST